MRIIIHRGTREIGGSCVELTHGAARLILDVGAPLPPSKGAEVVERREDLPGVAGLFDAKDNVNPDAAPPLGVLLSHAHADHFGWVGRVRGDVPVYASEKTHELIRAVRLFVPDAPLPARPETFQFWRPFALGPFTVTPYLVDHSAPDAAAFAVTAGGKTVFYTGDFRAHGRYPRIFENMLERPPSGVDALLMEGTTLDRDAEPMCPNERAVETALADAFARIEGLAFVFTSSQNIDRVISISRAAVAAGKTLVLDPYTALVLWLFKDRPGGVPHYYDPHIRILRGKYYETVLTREYPHFLRKIAERFLDADTLAANPSGHVLLAKPNGVFDHLSARLARPATAGIIWSQWRQYLDDHPAIEAFAERHKIPIQPIHVSGHATRADLQRLVDAVKPGCLVPIHTTRPDAYASFGVPVRATADGEVMSL